jgi:FKBP-type peptidyl-prolyl cis-trans isomerase FkpA
MKKLLFLALLFSTISACKKDYDKIDKDRIETYLKDKGLTAQKTASGVYFIIEKEGTGAKPVDASEIAVKYKGYTLDDKEFDKGDSLIINLSQTIVGWQDGMKEFKKGSSGKILIPSSLAYASTGAGPIGANEPVVFDIKLLDIDVTERANKKELKAYAAKKGWKLDSLASGLFYVIDLPGTGENPTINSKVTVTYKGYTSDDKVFDGTTSTFPLSNVIKGWQQGIPLFKKGGKGKLLIPSKLAYGIQGSGNIKPRQPIIFDVELIDF